MVPPPPIDGSPAGTPPTLTGQRASTPEAPVDASPAKTTPASQTSTAKAPLPAQAPPQMASQRPPIAKSPPAATPRARAAESGGDSVKTEPGLPNALPIVPPPPTPPRQHPPQPPPPPPPPPTRVQPRSIAPPPSVSRGQASSIALPPPPPPRRVRYSPPNPPGLLPPGQYVPRPRKKAPPHPPRKKAQRRPTRRSTFVIVRETDSASAHPPPPGGHPPTYLQSYLRQREEAEAKTETEAASARNKRPRRKRPSVNRSSARPRKRFRGSARPSDDEEEGDEVSDLSSSDSGAESNENGEAAAKRRPRKRARDSDDDDEEQEGDKDDASASSSAEASGSDWQDEEEAEEEEAAGASGQDRRLMPPRKSKRRRTRRRPTAGLLLDGEVDDEAERALTVEEAAEAAQREKVGYRVQKVFTRFKKPAKQKAPAKKAQTDSEKKRKTAKRKPKKAKKKSYRAAEGGEDTGSSQGENQSGDVEPGIAEAAESGMPGGRRTRRRTGKATCHECNEAFASAAQLLFHQQTAHEKADNAVVTEHSHWPSKGAALAQDKTPKECDKCGATYKGEAAFAAHLVVRKGAGRYPCVGGFPNCEKLFATRCEQVAHKGVHRKKRPTTCPYCGKKFKKPDACAMHVRTHTGEKPFRCQYCNKGFAQRIGKTQHERIHTNEKPYSCNVCGKDFRTFSALRCHVVRHVSERRFLCTHPGCDYKGKTEVAVRNHKKVHLRVKHWPCYRCGRVFGVAGGLRNHKKATKWRNRCTGPLWARGNDSDARSAGGDSTDAGPAAVQANVDEAPTFDASECDDGGSETHGAPGGGPSAGSPLGEAPNVKGPRNEVANDDAKETQFDEANFVTCSKCEKVFLHERFLTFHKEHIGFRSQCLKVWRPADKAKKDDAKQADTAMSGETDGEVGGGGSDSKSASSGEVDAEDERPGPSVGNSTSSSSSPARTDVDTPLVVTFPASRPQVADTRDDTVAASASSRFEPSLANLDSIRPPAPSRSEFACQQSSSSSSQSFTSSSPIRASSRSSPSQMASSPFFSQGDASSSSSQGAASSSSSRLASPSSSSQGAAAASASSALPRSSRLTVARRTLTLSRSSVTHVTIDAAPKASSSPGEAHSTGSATHSASSNGSDMRSYPVAPAEAGLPYYPHSRVRPDTAAAVNTPRSALAGLSAVASQLADQAAVVAHSVSNNFHDPTLSLLSASSIQLPPLQDVPGPRNTTQSTAASQLTAFDFLQPPRASSAHVAYPPPQPQPQPHPQPQADFSRVRHPHPRGGDFSRARLSAVNNAMAALRSAHAGNGSGVLPSNLLELDFHDLLM